MNLPLHIARRYLFSKKSHHTIHLISLVSVLGVASATLAMVCVLSAFNGFQDLLSTLYSHFDPDIKITATKGKSFSIDTPAFDSLRHDPRIEVFCPCLQDNCLAKYKESQTNAVVKGIPDNFSDLTGLDECIYAGSFKTEDDGILFACVGMGVASTLGTGYSFVDPITLYAPRRTGHINLANPAASLKSRRILPSGMFCIGQPEYDDSYILVPLNFAQDLLEYEPDDVTSVELKICSPDKQRHVKESIQQLLGQEYTVQDLQEQKSEFFHVTRMEKYVTFLMLSFILVIALFNVIGSLSMLILEKRHDADILSYLGADDMTIRRVFLYEGWMIAGIGGILGIVAGTLLCMAQQQFGFLKLGGGGFIVDSYPVVIRIADLLLILFTVMAVSLPSIWWPIRYIFGSRKQQQSRMERFSILVLLFLIPFSLQAQRPHGGHPLDESAIDAARHHCMTKCLHPTGIELPAFDVDSAKAVDSQFANIHGAVRFAQRIPVDINPDNSGETFYTDDGTKIWLARIRSKGAKSLNVIFDTFIVPTGAQLFLYNPDRSVILGAFTNENMQESGELPTAPVEGEELVIEYHEPPTAEFSGELQIYGVNHDYVGLRIERKFKYLNFPCLDPLSCAKGYEDIGRSVCLLIMEGCEYCTGVFINNTRQDGRPFILTASHCFSQENESLGSRTLVFMNYESPRCMTSIQGSEEFSLTGCTTRAISKAGDFALLELNEMPPADYRPYFAGWNLRKEDRHNAPFTCIHHPYGEGKHYAIEEDSLAFMDWPGSDGISKGIHWNAAQWEHSHTWKGSSGAPLFDSNGAVIGILSGGDSGGENGCESYEVGDLFVRIDTIWTFVKDDNTKQLKCWLDPDGKENDTLNGMDPYKQIHLTRCSNIQRNDSIERFFYPSFGYLFGTNTEAYTVAEEFHSDSTQSLTGVYIMPCKGWYSSQQTINISIRAGNNPDSVLYETPLRPTYSDYTYPYFSTKTKNIFKDKENFVRFDSAVFVGKHFFVACEFLDRHTAEPDTFALYGAHTPLNTAWFHQDEWLPFPVHDLKPGICSMWIEPLMHYTPAKQEEQPSKTNEELIVYSDASSRVLTYVLPKDWYESISIDFYDISGKHIFSRINNYGQHTISVPRDIPQGIYFLRLKDLYHIHTQKIFIR